MKIKFFSILLFFFIITNSILAQEKEKNIFINRQQTQWENFVINVERENSIRLFYNQDSIPKIEISVLKDSMLLEQVLAENFSAYGISISKDNQGNYFLFKNFSLQSNLDDKFFKPQVKNYIQVIQGDEPNGSHTDKDFLSSNQDFISRTIVIGTNGKGTKKGKATLSGYVTSSTDGDPIPQARLKVEETKTNVVTNSDGYYEIQLAPGNYTLNVNSLGMHEQKFHLTVLSNGQLNIPLKTSAFLIQETIVSANRSNNVRSANMGFERLTPEAIKKLPLVLGELDIIKVALLLPGVQTIGEISSGFNVRGSPADQNMFYINNLPIYSTSHLFGLFTTFNSDAVSEFKFYKSNIPIEFGDHLSSIFDIDAKKGNFKNFSMRGGIGPASSRLLVEGPLKKESSSYLISVRSSYSDWFLNKIDNVDIKNSSASFKDALMNFSFKLNEKNNLDIFFYGSTDFSNLAFGIKDQYSNVGSSIKWTHVFNNYFIGDLELTKSRYSYTEDNYEVEYLGNKHSFDLNHNELKVNFKNLLEKHTIHYGINTKFYKLNNGDFLPLNQESVIKPISYESEKAISNCIFIGDQWEISDKITIEAGIRGTIYSYLGPKTVYSYQKNEPIESSNITDTATYGNNEPISNYKNLDYRLSGKYEFTPDFSIKASYNKLNQYIFMLSSSVSVSPTNKWKLCDPHLRPMIGEQYSLGLFKNFLSDKIETSVEYYYKEVQNLVEYKDGADLLTNPLPETNIIQGNLNTYGLELMLKKKTGKINGWVNYTYSRAKVKAVNSQTGEMNNLGYAYSANYDRPHALNLTMNYKASRRLSISANMVYSTGRPITFPTSLYYQNGVQVIGFSKRNGYRLPDYFRTDLSINFEGNYKKNKIAHSSWSISFYNLTARRNPYSIVFQSEEGIIKGYKISILGTIIPSINFNLKFGNYEN